MDFFRDGRSRSELLSYNAIALHPAKGCAALKT